MNTKTFTIATGNQNKVAEYKRMLPNFSVVGVDLDIQEIQSEDPVRVLEQKAIDAWLLYDKQPILVEDTSLSIISLENLPGPFADQFTNTITKREALCRMVPDSDRAAIFKVGLARFDGSTVQTWIGSCYGQIAKQPRGHLGFGFGDIFIPDGQEAGNEKTNGEFNPVEKDERSPRLGAVKAFLKSYATNSDI